MNRNSPPPARPALARQTAESQRLPLLLRRAWYGLNQAFRRRILHLGLTPDQYTVLRTVREYPGLSQRELTQRMSSDPNTVASLMQRMEQAGLLTRHLHPNDRRIHRLRLTTSGRNKFRLARRFALELQEEILAVVPETHRTLFLEQLVLLSDACRQAAETDSSKALDSGGSQA